VTPFETLLIIPGALALLSIALPWRRVNNIVNVAGYLAYGVMTTLLVRAHLAGADGPETGPFHHDALTLLILIIISLVGLAGVLYSASFIVDKIERHSLAPGKYRKYFALYNLLFFAMTLLVLVDNIGIMWVSIEATTLASALMVSFDNRRESVEAAWRYLLICSIGIAFALFGTVLTYYASSQAGGPESGSLSWRTLMGGSATIDPASMKFAFLFLLLGYGTKAGLVPMARWKPQTYGEAPSPVSAVMSGALVACSLYTLIRFAVLCGAVLGAATVSRYLIFFGIISVAFSVPLIIAENDVKRVFAYSSIEHVGIITVGLGFGTFFGIYGALLHILNNSVMKTALFLSAGNLVSATGEKDVRRLSCMIRSTPLMTIGFLAAVVAVTAMPPFSLFLSEFNIIRGGIQSGNYLPVGILLLALFLVFTAFYVKFSKVAFGDECQADARPVALIQQIIPVVLLVPMLLFGFYIPSPLHRLLVEAASLFGVKP
jgi:hydrogenase-4 component F